ncbi:ATP-binding protein [Oerskovia turbata]|uniref:ATP-binding protein n=1 Tax=Oerskovia turbata TaxID=1713 RepID=A0A4Q1L011_9CELL|nr:ATP-binding protein [Oerskovia turbata]RXR28094.1 ATP-binding protein [Oerskovia turbata]RXR35897.1 ATP-binding protein [Oerskovia turbata]TGJ94816.1 hypothetical protein DLJ96_17330 [Actinotalea fermentans ATCC 43279 = JCM 9966 = DSM 3133]
MSTVSVERFWCTRGGDYALDEDGLLRDRDSTWFGARSANPDVVRTDELGEHRCLALLGEPGAGKSTVITGATQLAPSGVPVLSFDLASYGSEDRLVREVFNGPDVVAWAGGADRLCLVLDSLDEVRTRVPNVGAVVADSLRRLPHDRLIMRITCRTADWPAGLERSLEELFGAITVAEILPLRRVDVSAIAAMWCDPARFLNEVALAGAGPLAARPLTLRFLARSFGQSGRLPERGAGLYAAGVRHLCEEQNPVRRDAGLDGALQANERVAIARRIAAVTTFGGIPAIWTGPEVDADGEDVAVGQLAGGAEPTASGSVKVTVPAVLEVVRSGLFTSRGGQRLGWAHATFADFLAADWVVANDLSESQARSLFLGPDGRCWPQTRLAAAWTVAIAPDRFEFLALADPAAFQGEVELPGDGLRAAVIDGLFASASTLTVGRWDRSYGVLRHRDVAEQIRCHLRDVDPDRRRLALELAEECAAIELRDDLVAIATDFAAEPEDRLAAGWVLTRLPVPERTASLRPLATGTAARGEDPDDDLKGVALLASWPQAITSAEVFSVLTPRRRRNYHGSYANFLDRFRESVDTADIDAGLRWLLSDLNTPADDHVLGALANRVLMLAARRPTDRVVVDAFAQVVAVRAEHYDGLRFEDHRGDEREDPLADPLLRRAVVVAVLAAAPPDSRTRRAWDLCSLAVVRAEDLAWLAELYTQVQGGTRDAVRSLFQMTYDIGMAEHRDLVLSMSRVHPLHADLVHAWVDPIALDSPEAGTLRQERQAALGRRRPRADMKDNLNEQVEERLAQFDKGEGAGFWYSMRLLTVVPGSKHFGAEFDPDVVGMKRWPTLSVGLQERLVDSADRYLRSYPCRPQEWLKKPGIRHYPADAGYRAMVLLLRVAPDRLRQLPASVWIEWAPVLASWTTALVNGATWADKMQLLDLAGSEGRDRARAALVARVEATIVHGERPLASNEASYLWDDTVAATYLSLARSAGEEPREELVASLAKNDFEGLRELLLEWLDDASDDARRHMAARTLIDCDLERSWPAVKAALDSDLESAEQVLGRAMVVRGHEQFDHVPAAVLGDLYLWLRARFPSESDPQFDETHFVGPREQIGQWRDRLLRELQDAGSLESVEAIRVIVSATPGERGLLHVLAIAEAGLRRNQWVPTSMSQLVRLSRDHSTLVVNDGPALGEVVGLALADVQARLTGATPESHYLWDTYAGRPKSEDEVSDYLANELARVVPGAVVNREVQVRRNRPSGIGERTDLLVEAVPPSGPNTGRLCLPIEVKGAWNTDLCTAMRDQLVERYMRDTSASHGIYLVVWPDLASWADDTDKRRQVLASLDRRAIEAELAAQAAALAVEGPRVRVVHLGIDYLRPS